jgi:hypothetical protein
MKRLLFAFLLTGAVLLAQATGGTPVKAENTVGGKSTTSKTKTRTREKASGKKATHDKEKGGGQEGRADEHHDLCP